MRLGELLPESVRGYWRLWQLRRRFPGRVILSHLIGDGAALGVGCSLGRGVQLGPRVVIGDYSYLNDYTIVGSGRVGKYCSIGYLCQLGMHEHPVRFISTSPLFYGECNLFGDPAYWDDFPAPPLIGHDVWVGSHASILQGVTVGDGAVIAGGAVVTKDVPPYAVVAGVPARVIRQRFSDEEVEYLRQLRWWDLPREELLRLRPLFLAGEQWSPLRAQFPVEVREGGRMGVWEFGGVGLGE